jgi:hypothetical protein
MNLEIKKKEEKKIVSKEALNVVRKLFSASLLEGEHVQ